MNLVLDTGVLGALCHPRDRVSRPVADWLNALLDDGRAVISIAAIVDYELRRKLLHLAASGRASPRSIDRLDEYCESLDYVDLTTEMIRHAAELWAEARRTGRPTAHEAALDGDVILAAQALAVSGTVVTTKPGHLSRFVAAKAWGEIA